VGQRTQGQSCQGTDRSPRGSTIPGHWTGRASVGTRDSVHIVLNVVSHDHLGEVMRYHVMSNIASCDLLCVVTGSFISR